MVLPLWSAYADHSPRFLPAPQSRGRPYQYEPPGAAPLSAARPAAPPLPKLAKRHGQRTPAELVPQKAEPAPAYPFYFLFLLGVYEWSCPSGLLTQTIHPAFYPRRKAADDRTSTSNPAHSSHAPQPDQHPRHSASPQNATGSEPRRSWHRRKPT